MKTAIGVGGAASGQRRDFEKVVDYALEAEKLGVDRGTVGDWERGVRLPGEGRLAAVEVFLSPGGGKPA